MCDTAYVLHTGDAAEARLEIVDRVHGRHTEAFLLRAGLGSGMAVAEFGCGVGLVTERISRIVGPLGRVTALDASLDQTIAARRRLTARMVANVDYVVADAMNSGLKADTYEFVYCRFLLMHLPQPELALQEMKRVLKPGGVLAVEDGDFSSPFSWPSCPSFEKAFRLYVAAGAVYGNDFLIGQRLYGMVSALSMDQLEIETVQPACTNPDECELVAATLEECRGTLVDSALASPDEIENTARAVRRCANLQDSVFGMARMTQVSGRKPERAG